MLATLSDLLFSGKGRGDWEALEGLLWRVGSLEGSLGLLSRDFHSWTVINPSSLVEGATGGVVMEADVVFHGGGGGKFLLGLSLGLRSSSAWTSSSQETCLCPRGVSPPPGSWRFLLHQTPPWGTFLIYSVGVPSPLL